MVHTSGCIRMRITCSLRRIFPGPSEKETQNFSLHTPARSTHSCALSNQRCRRSSPLLGEMSGSVWENIIRLVAARERGCVWEWARARERGWRRGWDSKTWKNKENQQLCGRFFTWMMSNSTEFCLTKKRNRQELRLRTRKHETQHKKNKFKMNKNDGSGLPLAFLYGPYLLSLQMDFVRISLCTCLIGVNWMY